MNNPVYVGMRWMGHVARMRYRKGVYRVLVGKTDGKRPLGRTKYRQENNIEDLKERGRESVNWIDMAQYKCMLWAIVNKIIYLFHKMRGISLLAE